MADSVKVFGYFRQPLPDEIFDLSTPFMRKVDYEEKKKNRK